MVAVHVGEVEEEWRKGRGRVVPLHGSGQRAGRCMWVSPPVTESAEGGGLWRREARNLQSMMRHGNLNLIFLQSGITGRQRAEGS